MREWHEVKRKYLTMELKEHFREFYQSILTDPRIGTVHISMYMALLIACMLQDCENPIQINREALMHCAKINARATYYKSLQDLHSFGYITYVPSHNLFLGSLVYLKKDLAG
jgi:hypothetical protein